MAEIFSFRRQTIELPGELVEEILCKLPVKSLLRFKTVCKSWNLLIDSHFFIDKHLHRKNPQLCGYAVHFHGDILPVRIDRIVGDCNGIICLESLCTKKPLVLFNPSTREFSYVPPQLCFPGFPGFCYLPKTQEYQIVFFSERKNYGSRNVIDVTTLTLGKIASTRVAKNLNSPGCNLDGTETITSGTSMYWVAMDHDTKDDIVMWYDVIEGRFSKMEMPPSPSYFTYWSGLLRVLKGSVIMFVSPPELMKFFEIWMIVDDVSNGKSWMKYRTIGPLERVYPINVWGCDRYILCSNDDGQNGYLVKSDNFYYYDLETDQVEDYSDFHAARNDEYEYQPIWHFTNYVESLVSIKSLVPYIDTDC